MSLNNFQVYSEYAYNTMIEMLDQELTNFVRQSGGMIQITRDGSLRGDYRNSAFFELMADSIRHRNPRGTASLNEVTLNHKEDVGVKVGRSTELFKFTKTQFRWINENPQLAGVKWGTSLAQQKIRDYVNTAIGVLVTAISGETELVRDITGATTPADKSSYQQLHRASALFGDRWSAVRGWVMHSTPFHEMAIATMNNAEQLFEFETIQVYRDPMGRLFLVTDSPELVNLADTPDSYNILGLTENAIRLSENSDFEEASLPVMGEENIGQQYQAEWSFNIDLKGFAWDKANGGASPDDATLRTGTNWDNIMESHKDLPGVMLKCNQ